MEIILNIFIQGADVNLRSYFFFGAAFFGLLSGTTTSSVSVDSPAREGPVFPKEDDPKEVRIESSAAEADTLIDAVWSTETQPAASVPAKARND